MATNYWSKYLDSRVSRRRALAATGSAAVAAALLAACGGDDGGGEQGSGLIFKPVDRTKEAVRGGIYKSNNDRALNTLDPQASGTSGAGRDMGYQRPLMPKPGILQPGQPNTWEGDAVSSWEYAPDKLTQVLKLRPENHFDLRAPTNGRVVEAKDLVYTLNRLQATGGRRLQWFNSLNPDNALSKWEEVDKFTLKLTFVKPDPGFLGLLGGSSSSYFHITPTESEKEFELRNTMRGSGPFTLDEYVPDARMIWKRNPGYWNKQFPIVDGVDWPIISEYASGLAQFRAGATYNYAVAGEDILPTKNDVPALNLYANQLVSGGGARWFFGFKDDPINVMRDVRMRQAFSMVQDRDLWIDTFFNVTNFRAQGLPIQTAWNTAMRPGDVGWWLDPKTSEFGENAKYYKHDVAEAKKLVAAAGYPNGVKVLFTGITDGAYGRDLTPRSEAIFAMMGDAGMQVEQKGVNFAVEWRPNYTLARGQFVGALSNLNDSGRNDNGQWLYDHYHPNGANYMGGTPDGSSAATGDPFMIDLCSKLIVEFDDTKRIAWAKDLQKYEGKMQYLPIMPGGANTFFLTWPALANVDVYQDGDTDEKYVWVDTTKAPIA